MVFHFHCEPLHRGIEAGTLGHCPRFHDPVELEPKVEVEVARRVFLNDEAQGAAAGSLVRVKSRFALYVASEVGFATAGFLAAGVFARGFFAALFLFGMPG